MQQNNWVQQRRLITVCVDDYSNGEVRGRFYNGLYEMDCFENMTQFLLKMELALEEYSDIRPFTTIRSFSCEPAYRVEETGSGGIRNGGKANFQIQVMFRQHTSWQGIIIWKEGRRKQCFRSALELIHLMDDVLRTTELIETGEGA